MKPFLQNVALLCGTVAAFLIALEIVLRFLPVNGGLVADPVNAQRPIFHFQPNQELIWSYGPTFSRVNRIRTNNAGFVNDHDYEAGGTPPPVAVVGDSQVEAAMVPFDETLHGRLGEHTGQRVYSFAASGAPLSQYIVWAKHAKDRWKAGFLVVIVIGNDFDESLIRYKASPGFHHYEEGPDGLYLRRVDYAPGLLRGIATLSATSRYLLFNAKVLNLWGKFSEQWTMSARANEHRFAGNTSASLDKTRVHLSKWAVEAFLRDIVVVGGWSAERVLFVVDGFRYPDRAEAQGGTYFGIMRRYFIEAATVQGFSVIDMDEIFFADHAASEQSYEFPDDGHWNGNAHGLVEQAILGHDTFSQWLAAVRE